jgi:hypothetical protein
MDHDTSRLPPWLRRVPTPLFAMSVLAYPLVDTFRIFVCAWPRGVARSRR